MHCFERCLQDIDAINLIIVNSRNREINTFFFNHRSQQVTFLFSQLLAVIQQWVMKIERKNNSSGEDRPCKTSTACLIEARFFHSVLIIGEQHFGSKNNESTN